MTENELSQIIIGASIEVHKELGGPGLLESIYEEALCAELELRNIPFVRQIEVPIVYMGHTLNKIYRLDLLVSDRVIVEVKAVESFAKLYLAQSLTQLRVTNKKLGLVINFGERYVKDGVHRVVNGLELIINDTLVLFPLRSWRLCVNRKEQNRVRNSRYPLG
jgi:GxxExxY protein